MTKNLERSTAGTEKKGMRKAVLQVLATVVLITFSFAASAAITQIYFTEANGVFRVNPNGTDKTLIGDTSGTKHGIDVDEDNKKLYWTNIGNGAIRRSSLLGTGITEVATSLDVNGIVVDGDGGKIYFDRGPATRTVEKIDLDGTGQTAIAGPLAGSLFSTPVGMAINAAGTIIYWVDSTAGKLYSVGSGGGVVTTILDFAALLGGGTRPTGLAIDEPSGKFYATLDTDNRVVRGSLTPSLTLDTLLTTVDGIDRPRGIDLDLDAGHMYFTTQVQDTVFRAKLDGTELTSLLTGLDDPDALAVTSSVIPLPPAIVLAGSGCVAMLQFRRRRIF